jgi:hypothetical protein
MIGPNTKKVICFQNYSKSCCECELHKKKIERDKTPDVPVIKHHCLKGMKAKAALDEGISAFIDIVCIDDDASTKAYLSHSFWDLDTKGIP